MSDKIAAGRARKAAAKEAAKDHIAAEAAAVEDEEWRQGTKKSNKKQEADAERKARAAERKAEATAQLAAEEEEASAPKAKKKDKGSSKPKLTRAEIAAKAMASAKQKEKEKAQEQREIAESGGNEYIGVLRENDNRAESIDASGIEAAIEALDVGSPGPKGRVNMKALYKEFEETEARPAPSPRTQPRPRAHTPPRPSRPFCASRRAQLQRLKQDQPGLKLSQYKERVWAAWQKAPENPMAGLR